MTRGSHEGWAVMTTRLAASRFIRPCPRELPTALARQFSRIFRPERVTQRRGGKSPGGHLGKEYFPPRLLHVVLQHLAKNPWGPDFPPAAFGRKSPWRRATGP